MMTLRTTISPLMLPQKFVNLQLRSAFFSSTPNLLSLVMYAKIFLPSFDS